MNAEQAKEKTKQTIMAISREEMAVLIAEGLMGVTRPKNTTPQQAFEQLHAQDCATAHAVLRAADRVAAHLVNEINAAGRA